MGTFSIWHWLIVLAIVLLLFGGRGKIPQLLGDFGKGLKAFKRSVKDDSEDEEGETKVLRGDSQTAGDRSTEKKQTVDS